jgi:hypothetical protein
VSASIGTAVFSVLLTNGFNAHPESKALRAAAQSGRALPGGADFLPKAYSQMSHAFASSYVVSVVLVVLCLVPVWFLPRHKAKGRATQDAVASVSSPR